MIKQSSTVQNVVKNNMETVEENNYIIHIAETLRKIKNGFVKIATLKKIMEEE